MIDVFKSVDNSWTLFLDRDGVINKRPMNDYVKSEAAFEFIPGVRDAVKILSQKFNRILVVTNQQGIGKKLMSERQQSARYLVNSGSGRFDSEIFWRNGDQMMMFTGGSLSDL